MLNRYRAAVGLCALIALGVGGYAYGAGIFSTLPEVGSPSYCGSTVSGTGNLGGLTGQGQGSTGSICGQTIPAGPPQVTGSEDVEVDTNITGSGPPQVAKIPTSLLAGATNRLIGGDMNINLWQRGTTPATAQTPTAALMTADRFWIQTATTSGTQMTVTKQTGSTGGVADTIPALGFNASMRVQRPSGQTGTAVECTGQTLDSKAFAPLLGNNAVFSFYAQTGANFSPTSGITVSIAAYTAADATSAQSTIQLGGTNTQTSALSAAGQSNGITNYTAEVVALSPINPVTGSITSGVATLPIAASTAFARYGVAATIPTTLTSSATAVTGGVVSICWTPVGTAGANDWIEFPALQLEAKPSTATASLPNGVVSPTAFERNYAALQALYQQSYSYVVVEGTTTANRAICGAGGTTSATCFINFPTTMRQVPAAKYTTGFAAGSNVNLTTVGNCSALATSPGAVGGTALTPNAAMVQCTATLGSIAVGQVDFLWDNAGSGVMSFSAEP